MTLDTVLFVVVFVVWILLAMAYAFVPMFAMPGYAVVWGWGSLVFLALAVLVARAVRRRTRREKNS